MKLMLSTIVVVLCFPIFLLGQGEKSYPVVGKPCPDFVFNDIRHYITSQASLSDFKGKWLLLDFWSKGCSGCVTQFPKMDTLHEQYKDVLQVLLVGKNEGRFNKDIDVLYEKIRVKQQLNLPIAYDSIVFKQFGIEGVPGVVIIDPDGIVKAVTYAVKPEKIVDLLNGASVWFTPKPSIYEAREMDSIRKNTSRMAERLDEILAGSYISPWKYQTQKRAIVLGFEYTPTVNEGYFEVVGATLIDLYKYAYVGRSIWWSDDSLNRKLSQFPVFELTDPGLFEVDFETGKGCYNYYLRTPVEKAGASYFRQIMKQDLGRLFGYEVSFEERDVDCWKLTASASARKKLATTNGAKQYYHDLTSLKLVNVPVKTLITYIESEHQFQPVFLDATGISTNIDISLEVMLTDFEDVKKQLARQGLFLEKAKTVMTVMVFRDGEKR